MAAGHFFICPYLTLNRNLSQKFQWHAQPVRVHRQAVKHSQHYGSKRFNAVTLLIIVDACEFLLMHNAIKDDLFKQNKNHKAQYS
jgi:hypothetical protein